MIVPSEFEALSRAGLQPLITAMEETFNGDNVRPGYNFRRFLPSRRYSIDGTFQAMGVDNGLIVADVVALDSPLPVKNRPSVKSEIGEIPKIGTELTMNETDMKQLRLLRNGGGDADLVAQLYFNDVRRVYGGVLEQIEAIFLQGLSTGFGLVSEYNVGVGIRLNYGYNHNFGVVTVWGTQGYTAVGDLVNSANQASADGNSIGLFLMNRASLNQLLSSPDARDLFANSQGLESVNFNPNLEQINRGLETNYGFRVEMIERPVTYQVNGVKTTVNPWAAGQVVGIPSDNIGSIVWSDVEEMSQPVAGVSYARAEEAILISQYKTVRPSLKHYTASQAVMAPVINGTNIYKLDTTSTVNPILALDGSEEGGA